ncbi:DegT/DnrJ/EryC1/StrS family aminotransferase, partial [Patescibacteria group bacterium]|nr:DegT/DnrJ/EryC1/StrS family aminotransferase [Patescibacteria group bacterium]
LNYIPVIIISLSYLPAYKDFGILTNQRDYLCQFLSQNGIQTKKYFFPLHKMPYFEKYSTKLPVTELVGDQSMCLPIYNEMSNSKLEFVCKMIKAFYENKKS